jgi:hypothetical protein
MNRRISSRVSVSGAVERSVSDLVVIYGRLLQ